MKKIFFTKGIMGSSGGQVVLAGDPKQLGPVLRSPISIEFGLGLSLLERLMEKCDIYRPGDPLIFYCHVRMLSQTKGFICRVLISNPK